MATSITLTHGTDILTLRPSDFSDVREVTRAQVRSRTHDGNLVVGDKELTIRRFFITLNGLTDTDRANIENFFGASIANGSLNSFTYLDHFGVENTVRLINDSLDYTNTFTDLWTVDMTFEEVAGAGS